MQTIELSVRDYRLTTAEILYHLPDFPTLLQTYIWQNVDAPPKYPRLHQFLDFWEAELDGKLHSVRLLPRGCCGPTKSGTLRRCYKSTERRITRVTGLRLRRIASHGLKAHS